MLSQVLPVSTLNAYIQQVLNADDILADLWVEGEITSITYAKSGHIYFKICDDDALIDGAMWRTFASRQAFKPRVGDSVIVHGRIDYYSAQGRLQVIADVFEHQGQGILALEIERLRQQLEAEGLFDPARKRPLPRFPRRVGVVTSNTGAVWHDIQTVARRRFPLIELVLIPAAVQGAGAPAQIVAAIQQMCTLDSIDVMIVGRGGGSPEDLAPFNHESVARAIYASTIPVVSAVGHETDVSIADFVADVRAATPSAAAEIILPDMQELLTDLDDYRGAMIDSIEHRLADEQTALDRLQRRLALQSPDLRIERTRHELDVLRRRMATAARADVRRRGTSLGNTAKLLDALHPVRVMQRGFAMVEGPDRKPISRLADLPADGAVVVNFRDGAAEGSLTAIDTSPSAERHESEQT
jgi:exodeoxyribonuclease VII large subunit